MRAILFSGGVESTAALTLADKQDVLLVVEPYRLRIRNFHPSKALPIAAHFGLRVEFIKPPFISDRDHEDFAVLLPLASAWVGTRPGFTEVWFGANSEDWPEPRRMAHMCRMMDGFNIAHPGTPFRIPLWHLSKAEQWALIPEHIRPLVHSCSQPVACGTCKKCLERIDAGIPV